VGQLTRLRSESTPIRRRRKRRRPLDAPAIANSSSASSSLLRLQSVAGNAAVTRLIQTQPDRSPPAKSSGEDVPFPGVRAPGYQVRPLIDPFFRYTDKDRDALTAALETRINQNRENLAEFLGNYVAATIDIWGRYITSEMSATALQSGSGFIGKLLKFMLVESISILVGGGVGKLAKPFVSKITHTALEIIAEKVTHFSGTMIKGDVEKELLASDLEKRQKALDTITSSLASQTGAFVTAGVNSLKDDSVARTKWAMRAPLEDLDRFRIPEEITKVDKSLIRSVVAGVIAEKAHRHDAEKPCKTWGLQCPINEQVPEGSVGELDDNVIKIGLNPVDSVPPVNFIRFFSASPVLVGELAEKAQLKMVPTMALRIEVTHGDSTIAAALIMAAAAAGATVSDIDEENRLKRRYEEMVKQKGRDPGGKYGGLLTRNPKTGVKMAGMGLAESLWLYQLATGDHTLNQLAAQIELGLAKDASDSTFEGPSGTTVAELTYAVIEPLLPAGMEKLVAERLGDLVLPKVEPKGRRVAR
jgi:hypothetical protein